MVNVEKAMAIQGFINEASCRWLAEQASTRRRIVEIGSWRGRSTRAMGDHLREDGVLYAVDTWKGTPEDSHMTYLAGKPEDWLLQEFLSNLGDLIQAG